MSIRQVSLRRARGCCSAAAATAALLLLPPLVLLRTGNLMIKN